MSQKSGFSFDDGGRLFVPGVVGDVGTEAIAKTGTVEKPRSRLSGIETCTKESANTVGLYILLTCYRF